MEPTPSIPSFNGSENVYERLKVPNEIVAVVKLAASKMELFLFRPRPLTVSDAKSVQPVAVRWPILIWLLPTSIPAYLKSVALW